jgi:hypothetical protein
MGVKKEAKKVYSLARKEQRQTGGGPEIKLVTPAINRTIDLCRDSAAFNVSLSVSFLLICVSHLFF